MVTVVFRELLYHVAFVPLAFAGSTLAQETPTTSTEDYIDRLLHGDLSNGSNGSEKGGENITTTIVTIDVPQLSDETLAAHRKMMEDVKKIADTMPPIVIPNFVSETR